MTLDQALCVLVREHTQSITDAGAVLAFTVSMHAPILAHCSYADYRYAWAIVRKHLGLDK